MKKAKIPNKPGIYQIQSTINGKRYIGSAVNLKARKQHHINSLERKNHGNKHMQNHYNKYDKADLQFSIIEYCPAKKLIEKEQYYIDTLKPEFNILPTAGSNLGIKFSEEHKRKLSESHRGMNNYNYGKFGKDNHLYGMKHSEETKRKMSKNHANYSGINHPGYGNKHSEKAKEKMRLANIGKTLSEETKQKMSEFRMGKKLSDKTKRNMSKAQKGKIFSEETRKKLSIATKALWETPEYRKKLSEAHKDKMFSEEHKRKISIAVKAYWKKKKELQFIY